MLQLTKDATAIILRWASRHPTIEVVGLVWQHMDGLQTVHPLSNVHSQPDKYYTVDPQELQAVYARMGEYDGQMLAFYHSHPGGKPDPSEEDMAGALNVGVHYLIAYPWTRDDMVLPGEPNEPVWRLSAWECIETSILVEDKYEVVP